MRALLLPLALLLAAATALATPETGPLVAIDPDPPRADAPFRVTVTGLDAPVANATLQVCLAKDGAATFCLLPVPMRADGDALVAESAERFPAGSEVGVSVTLYAADGTSRHLPEGEEDPLRAYYFVTIASGGARAVPAVPVLALAALALAAALARR